MPDPAVRRSGGRDPRAREIPRRETEASLLARAQAGDVAAFERLSGAYADRLFMLLVRLLGDPAEAEDVAQEVMLRAWRGIARFRGQSSYFTWLYRIAVNEANRALEKRARQPAGVSIGARELDLPAAPEEEPSRQAENSELRLALGQALAGLPPPLRTAIVLRDVEGLSTQEAAEIAGVGQAAFKSRLHQARLRVRAAIGDEALAAPAGKPPGRLGGSRWQVSTSPSFTTLVLTATTAPKVTSTTLSGLAPGTYYWRVQSVSFPPEPYFPLFGNWTRCQFADDHRGSCGHAGDPHAAVPGGGQRVPPGRDVPDDLDRGAGRGELPAADASSPTFAPGTLLVDVPESSHQGPRAAVRLPDPAVHPGLRGERPTAPSACPRPPWR